MERILVAIFCCHILQFPVNCMHSGQGEGCVNPGNHHVIQNAVAESWLKTHPIFSVRNSYIVTCFKLRDGDQSVGFTSLKKKSTNFHYFEVYVEEDAYRIENHKAKNSTDLEELRRWLTEDFVSKNPRLRTRHVPGTNKHEPKRLDYTDMATVLKAAEMKYPDLQIENCNFKIKEIYDLDLTGKERSHYVVLVNIDLESWQVVRLINVVKTRPGDLSCNDLQSCDVEPDHIHEIKNVEDIESYMKSHKKLLRSGGSTSNLGSSGGCTRWARGADCTLMKTSITSILKFSKIPRFDFLNHLPSDQSANIVQVWQLNCDRQKAITVVAENNKFHYAMLDNISKDIDDGNCFATCRVDREFEKEYAPQSCDSLPTVHDILVPLLRKLYPPITKSFVANIANKAVDKVNTLSYYVDILRNGQDQAWSKETMPLYSLYRDSACSHYCGCQLVSCDFCGEFDRVTNGKSPSTIADSN